MKRLLLLAGWFALTLVCSIADAYTNTVTMLNAATTTGAGSVQVMQCPGNGPCSRTFTCSETVSSGSGSATVVFEGAGDAANSKWIAVVTTSVLTDTVPDGATDLASKLLVYRARVSAISGTGAAVTCQGTW